MSVLVNVRVPEHVRDTWKSEAEKLGVTLTDFVKGAVEARLNPTIIYQSEPPPAPREGFIPRGVSHPQIDPYVKTFKPDFKVPLVKKGKK